jgi:hypothetical protein
VSVSLLEPFKNSKKKRGVERESNPHRLDGNQSFYR